MKYVQRIEDSRLWKDQFEDSAKGKAKSHGAYYVVNQAGKGDNVHFIPAVAQDLEMAKSKIKSYKRKQRRKKTQSKRKPHRVKKCKKRVKVKRKTVKKRKTKNRRK